MTGTLKMPRMGETMEEGKLVAWLVEPGQTFKRGDALMEVETDKTVVEFPALGDGALIEPLVDLGEMVDVGSPIARIDVGDGPDWTSDGDNTEAEPEAEEIAPEPATEPQAPLQAAAGPGTSANDKVRATPLARRIAQQNGIDISTLTGSGRRGRVERDDVLALAKEGGAGLKDGLQTSQGLAFLEKGAPDGTPVMLVHGFAADHSAWAGVQSPMARAGCRTLTVDLPGHGQASLDAADLTDLTPPLEALAKERLGWSPIHIVAHSMGAVAAVALAKLRPVASVTLIAPAGVGRKINADFLNGLAHPQSADHLKRVLARLTTGPNGLSDAAIHDIFDTLGKGRVAALAKALAGASGQAVDIRADIAELAKEVPVSILLGHRDQIIDWSEALDISPLIATHHFPNAGHMPHWENPAAVLAVLERKVTS